MQPYESLSNGCCMTHAAVRKPFIAGNWKMNQTVTQANQLIAELKNIAYAADQVDVAVCPPHTALAVMAYQLKGSSIALGAQNVSERKPGAFTGDIAAEFLLDLGCTHSIIGHSERRQYHQENDSLINQKLHRLLELGLRPIFCVGETLEQRELEITTDVVHTQLRAGLVKISAEQAQYITVAYEPVWAIGTGKVATPQQAEEVHAFIRQTLSRLFGETVAQTMRIQYGGSVNAANAQELLSQPNIDGALVGGASLKPADFGGIIAAAAAVATFSAVR